MLSLVCNTVPTSFSSHYSMSFRVLLRTTTKEAKPTLLFGDFMAFVSSSEDQVWSFSDFVWIVGMINLFKRPCKYWTDSVDHGAHDVLSFKSSLLSFCGLVWSTFSGELAEGDMCCAYCFWAGAAANVCAAFVHFYGSHNKQQIYEAKSNPNRRGYSGLCFCR